MLHTTPHSEPVTPGPKASSSADIEKLGPNSGDTGNDHDDKDVSVPPISVPLVNEAKVKRQKWNSSGGNVVRVLVTYYAFAIMGMNDACVGALIPYLESYYNIPYAIVSLLFLPSFFGYLLAAFLSNPIHHYFGQRGIAFLGPLARLIGYVPLCLHPPFAALPLLMIFPGLGSGIEDSAWNAWIGNMESANELLGFLHGAYGLGATIAPLIATAMVAKAALPWFTFYYVLVGMTVVELVVTAASFWHATAAEYRKTHPEVDGGRRTSTRAVLKSPITWLVALFLLGYVGAEVSLGGWIVTFMLEVRHAQPFNAGLAVTFFWLGLTIGRVSLGFVTGRIGEKLAILVYMLLAIALQLLYWLIPSYVASAVFASFEGFFLGPLFPAAVVAATKLLPDDYHVSAIGFAAAFGGGGGAVFPFMVGAIASSRGVAVLQPIVLAILVFIVSMWVILPGGFRRGGLEQARDKNERVGLQLRAACMWTKRRLWERSKGVSAASPEDSR